MIRFIFKRLALLIPTVFGVVTLVFFMIALTPGDPARVMLGERASEKQLTELREQLGLNKPLTEQYGLYLKRVIKLDFGRSIRSGQNVIDDIKTFFPATIELTIFAMILASILGIWIGVLSATHKNTWIDVGSMMGALVGVSMPIFWLALVMIMVFSVKLDMFPTGSRMNVRYFFEPSTNFYLLDSFPYLFKGHPEYFFSALHHLILPAICLATIPLAIIARTTRSSMLEVMKQDYIKTVRSAGVKESRVVYRYALRNALLPVITVIGLQFGYLLSGAVLTETIFAWPGIGKWLFTAIQARDYPAVQGGIIFISTSFILINLVVDLLYSLINPKIRLS